MPQEAADDAPDRIIVYGRDTCEDTVAARRYLDANGHPYRYVNLDRDTAARDGLVAAGHVATPVVVGTDGRLIVEPTDDQLAGFLAGG